MFFFVCFLCYKVIPISWSKSWVWRVNFGWVEFFVFILIDFFNFILQYWVDWELSFIVCFDFSFEELSWFHDSGYGFDKLTLVGSTFFFLFFLKYFFFNFINKYWIDWELDFIFCFDLLYMGLLWFCDPSRKFDKLTQVNSGQLNMSLS